MVLDGAAEGHHNPVVVHAIQQDLPECKTVGLLHSGI